MEHDLVKIPASYQCKTCKWTWMNKTTTDCPGCDRYSWGGQRSPLNIDIPTVPLLESSSNTKHLLVLSREAKP
ncbi:MAG: hypothetical protein V7L20_26150 [Nostoc sp.]|uniref:hypothetical protein n=1 Tax=Nostoc sp. TaxID=1180 RepID=UPI002FFB581B